MNINDKIDEVEHALEVIKSQLSLYTELLHSTRSCYATYKQIISEQGDEYLKHLLSPDRELKKKFRDALQALELEIKDIKKKGVEYRITVETLKKEKRDHEREHKNLVNERAHQEIREGLH